MPDASFRWLQPHVRGWEDWMTGLSTGRGWGWGRRKTAMRGYKHYENVGKFSHIENIRIISGLAYYVNVGKLFKL
jgi:hypothetical protein